MTQSLLGFLNLLFCGLGSGCLAASVTGPRNTLREGEQPPYRRDLYRLRTIGFWVLFVLFVALSLLGCLAFLAPGLLVLVVGMLAYHRWWMARQHALLWTMAVCAERGIPLDSAVRAAAAERSGPFAAQVDRLADLLQAGVPLPAALQAVPLLVPADARAKIQVACQAGKLAPAVRDAIAAREPYETVWTAAVGRILYVAAVLLILCLVMFWMTIKIVPGLGKTFSYFSRELPPLTRSAIMGSHALAYSWHVLLVPLGLVALAVFAYVLLRHVGVLGAGAPGFRWVERRLVTAAILESLALVTERGRPLTEGLGVLAATYPSRPVRRRLARVLREIRSGADWSESLARRGLIGKADRAVLASAQRVGNLPWALREMADSNRRRHAYRAQIWVQILFPLAILAVGLIVGTVVVSFFLPLITLIKGLT